MMSVAILTLLGGWFFCSLVTQIPALCWIIHWIYPWDCFDLIPNWSFFSHPEGRCLHLWYQDTLLDGHVTQWHRMTLHNPSLVRVLWNPKKCHWKMLEYACSSLLGMEEHEFEEPQLLVSQPYVQVLTSVQAQPHLKTSVSRQFLITSTPLGQPTDMLFLSLKHDW